MTNLANNIRISYAPSNHDYLLICHEDGYSTFCLRVPISALKPFCIEQSIETTSGRTGAGF